MVVICTHWVGGATLSQSRLFLLVNLRVPEGQPLSHRWGSENFRLLFVQYSLVTVLFLMHPSGDFRKHCHIIRHFGLQEISDVRTLHNTGGPGRTFRRPPKSVMWSHERGPYTLSKRLLSQTGRSHRRIEQNGVGGGGEKQEDIKNFTSKRKKTKT